MLCWVFHLKVIYIYKIIKQSLLLEDGGRGDADESDDEWRHEQQYAFI